MKGIYIPEGETAMPVEFGKDTITKLQHLYTNLESVNRTELRNRFEMVDKYISREGDYTKEGRTAKTLVQNGRKDLTRNIEVPITFTKLDAEVSYQVGVFLTGFPIFGAVANDQYMDAALQMQALMGRDQQKFNWVAELILVLRDGLTYNICATDTYWHQEYYTQGKEKNSGQGIKYEGNAIKRIDPYNLIWDTSVKPNKVCTDGSFAGYVERKPYVATKKFLQSLSDEHKITQNIGPALKSAMGTSLYYNPKIRQETTATSDDWAAFFGFESANGYSNDSGLYDITTLYARVIPKDLNIIAPRSGDPDVYKLIYLNGTIVYAQRIDTNSFPIVICQPSDYGHGVEDKGFSENLTDVQDVATSLQIARMKSMRRSVSDRALYDPSKLDARHLSSDHPEAKIPVKNAHNLKSLSDAYYRIPFEDSLAPVYGQEFAMINSYADDISGVNKAAQGNFVKGNKTLFEFQDIMQNSRARSQVRSIVFEATLFHPIKEILKENYVNFAIAEQLFDRATKNLVEVDPQTIQDALVEFKISDGLLPSSKLINSDTLQLAFQMMATVPGFAQQYDAPKMAVRLLKGAGMEDLDDYRIQQQPTQPSAVGNPSQPTGGVEQQAGTPPAG